MELRDVGGSTHSRSHFSLNFTCVRPLPWPEQALCPGVVARLPQV